MRSLIAGFVVAAGLATAGFVAATTANADPIEDGATARIATQVVNGVRYCIIPTSELRRCGTTPATQYVFEAQTCWSTKLLCYRIRSTTLNECLYYDTINTGSTTIHKIGYGSCSSTSLRYRWRIDELNSSGTVRIRPASHTSRCVVYDPARLPSYPYTFIEECSSRPELHAWFRLLPA